jgi:hypothetical protein
VYTNDDSKDVVPSNHNVGEYPIDVLTDLVDRWSKFQDKRKEMRLQTTYARDPIAPI